MASRLAFILSSGRSGSRALSRLLAQVDGVSSNHEYVRDFTQRAIAEYHMGLRNRESVSKVLHATYGSAAEYSDARVFIDSNNKLCWVADLLPEVFPDATFVHLHRDGRKVTSSFFHKLKGVIYPPRQTEMTNRYLRQALFPPAGAEAHPLIVPPPTEDFWWIQPCSSSAVLAAFIKRDRFSQVCYHWTESNKSILDGLSGFPSQVRISLEALTSSTDAVRHLFEFLQLPFDEGFAEMLLRPDHVYVPVDFELSPQQAQAFHRECGEMMALLGYSLDTPAYRVAA
jgi:hypothetical protein